MILTQHEARLRQFDMTLTFGSRETSNHTSARVCLRSVMLQSAKKNWLNLVFFVYPRNSETS